jgi:cell division septum initiation protein DivIVA
MGEHLKEVEWIENLPGEGGDWGQGIVGTVRTLEDAVAEYEGQKAELDSQLAAVQAEIKSGKAAIDAKIKAKKKFLKSTVKRAGEEAPMMFGNAQIASARRASNPQPAGHSDAAQ